jgi:hypothetical protein
MWYRREPIVCDAVRNSLGDWSRLAITCVVEELPPGNRPCLCSISNSASREPPRAMPSSFSARYHQHRTLNCRFLDIADHGPELRRSEVPWGRLFRGFLVFRAGCRQLSAAAWIGVTGAARLAGLRSKLGRCICRSRSGYCQRPGDSQRCDNGSQDFQIHFSPPLMVTKLK